jgi:hypothetical protein
MTQSYRIICLTKKNNMSNTEMRSARSVNHCESNFFSMKMRFILNIYFFTVKNLILESFSYEIFENVFKYLSENSFFDCQCYCFYLSISNTIIAHSPTIGLSFPYMIIVNKTIDNSIVVTNSVAL